MRNRNGATTIVFEDKLWDDAALVVDVLRRELPHVDILVNNLGIYESKAFADVTDAEWQRYFDVNVMSGVRLARNYFPAMLTRNKGRVIFISAPLRGSELASNWLGRIGSSLVKSPVTLLKAGRDIFKITTFRSGELKLKRIPNSVDTLAPTNRFVIAINKIPITPRIPYHTIMGDRGRGDAPNSSDGVVPYWSSHMEGAESELIVPSAHPAHQNPKAIAEVRRILMLNLKHSETDQNSRPSGPISHRDEGGVTSRRGALSRKG